MSGQKPLQGLQPRFSIPFGRNVQDNFPTRKQQFNGERTMLNGGTLLPSSSPAVLGKRKSLHQTDGIKDSYKKQKYNEGNTSTQAMKMPLHYQPVAENARELYKRCTEDPSRPQVRPESITQPVFENVLEKLGRRHAPLLAQEIKQLNISRFPMDTMAEKLANKMILDHKAVTSDTNRESAVDSSIDVAVIVRSLLRDLRESITNPNTEIMEKLEDFDKVSQSFGLRNAVNHLDFLDQCISCLCTKLSKKNENSATP